MDRDTKNGHLNYAGLLVTHLEDDIVQLEHKVLQTTQDINGLKNRLEAIKQGMDDVHEDEDIEGFAITAIDAFARAVNHVSLAISHIEHKRDAFSFALTSVRAASAELNSYANSISGIPTTNE